MTLTSELLLERLTAFAQKCRDLTTKLPRNSHNIIYRNQLNRSSSSPGANYIEAIEASSSKEFALRLKICRKEIKESCYWLVLTKTSNPNCADVATKTDKLINEATELIRIFTASIITSERNRQINKMRK